MAGCMARGFCSVDVCADEILYGGSTAFEKSEGGKEKQGKILTINFEFIILNFEKNSND